ncbi:MAG: hypothetical protein ACLP1E_03190 [Acidimicrobiales bacterium]
MGALAHTDRGAPGWLREMEPSRPERTPARRGRPVERRRASRASWNVLAQELVAFPPPAGPAVRRPAQRPAHRPGLVRAVPAVPQGSAPARVAGCEAARVHDEVTSRRAVARAAEATPPAVGTLDHATSARSRQVAPRSRGLRRLLPGAATLAVLASVWFGTGALSSLHRPALTVPAAAVKVHGGYLYIARPGDTLWSIASGLQPGGDPRPLVAELEQQLHGAQLVAGDRLTLP